MPDAVAIGITFGRKARPDVYHILDDSMLGGVDGSLMRQHTVEDVVHIVTVADASNRMTAENSAYGIAELGVVIKAVQVSWTSTMFQS